MKKIGVLTSGGDSPGMNAAVRAVVRTASFHGLEVVGVKRGYDGLIEADFVDLDAHSVANILQRGGTILKSMRSDGFRTIEGRKMAFKNLKAKGIQALVVIGGDGSFTGASIFIEEFDFPIVGLPGTIDNDLVGTDFTIGYDTALNTVVEAVDKIRDTADSHNRLFVVEVMGKDAGFIALRAGIGCGAEAILYPESEEDLLGAIVERMNSGGKRKKLSNIIIVAEGAKEGNAAEVAAELKEKCPGYDIRVVVLGHIQRGGSPTCMERVRASQMGLEAVQGLIEGKRGVMIGIVNDHVAHTPFEKAIKNQEKIDSQLLQMIDILSI
ncbi:MAG: 6-phosphofructokinase 1 [Flavobacteriales bacterium]|jgi:6-phosphofructokinase 1|tara:strand:- start:71 stop:1045 length:975 start_codon:yes stop_codon:yes gene_type:complete